MTRPVRLLVVLVLVLGVAAAVLPPVRSAAASASAPESTRGAPERTRSAPDIVEEVRRHTARYADVAAARADGFVQASGMERHHGYHFLHPAAALRAAASGSIDLARPPMLLYVERDGVWRLAGVEYALQAPPAVSPLPGAVWHQHAASCHYRDYREVEAPTAHACPPVHPATGAPFVLWHPALAVAHVWAWIDNPAGPFAELNAALEPYGGTAPAGGHSHPRNEAEVAYSNLNHRVAGGFLLLIALVTLWETARPRRFPFSSLSAPAWVALGVYIVVAADPEAWPLGPGGFRAMFADAMVLQHKALAMIPIVIGVIEGLRGAGRLRAARWLLAFPALAMVGGLALFVHNHEGGFHLDRIFLQHAAMGGSGVALGVGLLLARRSAGGRTALARAWPLLLLVVSLVLLFYSET